MEAKALDGLLKTTFDFVSLVKRILFVAIIAEQIGQEKVEIMH